MRTFAKSDKLHGVCYDVRGPVLDAANEMKRQGDGDSPVKYRKPGTIWFSGTFVDFGRYP